MVILACIDFSPSTWPVISAAAAFAKALHASIHLLHVVDSNPPPVFLESEDGQSQMTSLLRQARKKLAVLSESEELAGLDVTCLVVEAASGSAGILAEAQRLSPDMIVLGSHGHGAVYHVLIGSTAQGVMRHTRWPVLIVPHDKPVVARAGRQAVQQA